MTPDAIKALRERNHWSQADLARELGVDQATVSRIERGAAINGPTRKLLERMAAESPAESAA